MLFATALLTMLADATDPLRSIYEHWPWMVIVVGIGKWFATIIDRATTRHICFIDALDKRDQESLVHQATTSIALGAISEKLSEGRSKLSGIEDKIASHQCHALPQCVPHGA